MEPRGKRRVIGLIASILVPVAVLAVLVGGCGVGDSMFYWPNNLAYLPQETCQLHQIENVTFDSTDGTPLHGWFVPARTTEVQGTVIFYHGNAQNLTAHYALVSWLADEGYNLFLFDYRGFGQSEGTPTRKGLHQDSLAAMQYVLSREDVDPRRLVAFGQSLGGACLVAALGDMDQIPVLAVAVDSTFASYRGVATELMTREMAIAPVAWLLAQWLVTGDHDPKDAIADISPVPLLVMHGDADRVVPFNQGRKLFEAAAEPKTFEHVPGGTHCDAIGSLRFGDRYRRQLADFFAAALAPASVDKQSQATAADSAAEKKLPLRRGRSELTRLQTNDTGGGLSAD